MISLQQVERQLANIRYWRYVKYVHRGRWISAPYLTFLCDEVQAFLEDTQTEYTIFCISLPPQHGKSMSLTETLPSWYIGKHKTRRVIEVSYNDDFAQKFGRRNREKIIEFGQKFFDISLSKSTGSTTEWELDNGVGGMLSKGVGGAITGNPADLIVIDDPVKNRQEAESEIYRERVWDEWLNSIRTRLSAKGKTIVIMTRWHEDDLVARMIKNEGSVVKVLNIPCEAEDDDPVFREPGEALGVVLGKDTEWMRKFKKVYETKEGSRVWQALYQGHPTAQEGNIFKRRWFKFYTRDPITDENHSPTLQNFERLPTQFDDVIQSWDCTFKDKDDSDYVTGQVWGRVGSNYYLLDRIKERLGIVETMSAILQMSAKWPRALLKLVEDKANGSAVIQMLQVKIPGMVAVEPDGGKIARANAVAPAFESGNVYLPDASIAPWVVEYMDEMCAFPNGAHDDEVDSTTQALNRFIYYTNTKPPEDEHGHSLDKRVKEKLASLSKPKRGGGLKQV